MLQAKIENNIVKSIIDATKKMSGYTQVTENVRVGDDIRFYDKNWQKKDTKTLVTEGLIVLKEDEKLVENQIIKKTDYELALEGIIKLEKYEYLDSETKSIKTASSLWLYENKHISKEEYEDLIEEEYKNSIPTVLSAYQARMALEEFGLLESVEAFIPKANKQVQIAWAYAQEFNRNNFFITSLSIELNISEKQLDALFLAGSKYL